MASLRVCCDEKDDSGFFYFISFFFFLFFLEMDLVPVSIYCCRSTVGMFPKRVTGKWPSFRVWKLHLGTVFLAFSTNCVNMLLVVSVWCPVSLRLLLSVYRLAGLFFVATMVEYQGACSFLCFSFFFSFYADLIIRLNVFNFGSCFFFLFSPFWLIMCVYVAVKCSLNDYEEDAPFFLLFFFFEKDVDA